MANHHFHILITGQTGAGKSSLINYIAQTPLAKAGAGLPVTEKGFFSYNIAFHNEQITLSDSWGIEPGKWPAWENSLLAFEKKMPIQLAFYVIDASSARVQSVDIEVIEYFKAQNIPTYVILSKANTLLAADKQTLAQHIPAPIIYVNSVSEQYIDGSVHAAYGKEDVWRVIQSHYKRPTKKERKSLWGKLRKK